MCRCLRACVNLLVCFISMELCVEIPTAPHYGQYKSKRNADAHIYIYNISPIAIDMWENTGTTLSFQTMFCNVTIAIAIANHHGLIAHPEISNIIFENNARRDGTAHVTRVILFKMCRVMEETLGGNVS